MTAPALTTYQSGASQVSGDNLNTFAQSCNSLADLRSFIGTTGVQVYMRGFVTPGDGGQGFFYWNASGIASDDGGITTIVPSGAAAGEWTRVSTDSGTGSGTVTSVSITTANGVSGTVLTPTTTPAITITLGAITPTTVTASGAVTGSNLSGTNTGDQTITLTGDATGTGTGSFAITIAANAVSNAKFRQGVARSVVGVTGNATANVADIQGAANQILSVNAAGTSLQFQSTMNGITIGATTPAAASFTTSTAGVITDSGSNSYGNVSIYTSGPYTLSGSSSFTNYQAYTAVLPVMSGTIVGSNSYGFYITSPSLAGSATLNKAYGTFITAPSVSSSLATLTLSYGSYTTLPSLSGASSIVNAFGSVIEMPTVATGCSIIGGAYGIQIVAPTISGTGSIGTCYGALIGDLGGTGITNTYGIFISAQSASSSNTYPAFYNSTVPWYIDRLGFTRPAGRVRVSTQFDKTSDTTLADVTGLTATVLASGVYSIRAHLTTTAGAAGGMKVAISGSATATTISYTAYNYNGTTINAVSTATALGTAAGAATAITTNIIIEGVIAVNAAGTLTVQMAQNASNGTASSILVNSKLIVERIS